jgi:hypothetical protein
MHVLNDTVCFLERRGEALCVMVRPNLTGEAYDPSAWDPARKKHAVADQWLVTVQLQKVWFISGFFPLFSVLELQDRQTPPDSEKD